MTVPFAVPVGPCAVSVYVVVCAGTTATEPVVGRLDVSSVPTGGLMVTRVALVAVQLIVANCPAVTLLGETCTVIVVEELCPPPGGLEVALTPPHPAAAIMEITMRRDE